MRDPFPTEIPHLANIGQSTQLVVDGKPFLMLAGELQNSSFTCPDYMDTVWGKLVDANFNTVLGCVTWELLEPTEGDFCFGTLTRLVLDARKHGLRLVLLWFGAFKNGKSSRTYIWP